MESLFAGGVLNLQFLIVVTVKGVECIGVIDNYIKQRATVLRQLLLILNCASQHLDQLAQLVILLRGNSLVDSVALQKVLFQYLISPDAELSTTFRLDAIANRYDYIKAVNLRWLEL